jgi:hypothetical protein
MALFPQAKEFFLSESEPGLSLSALLNGRLCRSYDSDFSGVSGGTSIPAACSTQTANKDRFLCAMGPTESPSIIDYSALVAEEYAATLGTAGCYQWSDGIIASYFRAGGVPMPLPTPASYNRSWDFIKAKAAGGGNGLDF